MNNYIIKFDSKTGKAIAELSDSKGRTFEIDVDDLRDVLEACTWSVGPKGYVTGRAGERGSNGDGAKRNVRLHRFIMGQAPAGQAGKFVDHINRKPWDNRKENLRFVTNRENVLNSDRCDYGRHNITGFVGVTKSKRRFEARIWSGGKVMTIGRYDTALEAAKAYDNFIESNGIGGKTNKQLGNY